MNIGDEQVVTKFSGGGNHVIFFNLWQAAAEMGGATRNC